MTGPMPGAEAAMASKTDTGGLTKVVKGGNGEKSIALRERESTSIG